VPQCVVHAEHEILIFLYFQITPAEIRRVSTHQVRCLKCGATFIPEMLKG
jgi:hypothetical protein